MRRIEYNKGDTVGNCIYLEERYPDVYEGTTKTIKRRALFKCKCGNEFEAQVLSVKGGHTLSCGCIRDNKIRKVGYNNKIHGKRNHPLYKMWQGMLRRCNNPKDEAYINYGGRGIKICERWLSIHNFIEDMYQTYSNGMDIDRINNNGDYEPSNCRWVTRKQNMNNMRRNRIIEYNNMRKTISEWSDYFNIPYKTLIARLNKWSSLDKAFTYRR